MFLTCQKQYCKHSVFFFEETYYLGYVYCLNLKKLITFHSDIINPIAIAFHQYDRERGYSFYGCSFIYKSRNMLNQQIF